MSAAHRDALECEPVRDLVGAPWVEHAACKGQAQLFFSARPYEPAADREAREHEARALCAVCPVVVECRAEGRTNREYGIWGGESESDRARDGLVPIGSSSLTKIAFRARRAERNAS